MGVALLVTGQQQQAARAAGDVDTQRGGGPERAVERLLGVRVAGVEDHEHAWVRLGREAPLQQLAGSAQPSASGSATPGEPGSWARRESTSSALSGRAPPLSPSRSSAPALTGSTRGRTSTSRERTRAPAAISAGGRSMQRDRPEGLKPASWHRHGDRQLDPPPPRQRHRAPAGPAEHCRSAGRGSARDAHPRSPARPPPPGPSPASDEARSPRPLPPDPSMLCAIATRSSAAMPGISSDGRREQLTATRAQQCPRELPRSRARSHKARTAASASSITCER